jgi:hypothetical protein
VPEKISNCIGLDLELSMRFELLSKTVHMLTGARDECVG